LTLKREAPEYFDRTFVSDGKLRFWTRREGPDKPFFIEALDNSASAEQLLRSFTRYETLTTRLPLSMGGDNFLEHVFSSDFKVESASLFVDDGDTLIKAAFKYVPSDKTQPKSSGWLAVDPSRNWVLRKYSYVLQYGRPNRPVTAKAKSSIQAKKVAEELILRINGSVSYKTEAGKTPTPSKFEWSQDIGDNRHESETVDISRWDLVSTPHQEFSLDAFGLGDVEKTARQIETRTSYWTAALASAAFLVSFLLFRLGRAIWKRRTDGEEIIPTVERSLEGGPSA